MKKIGAALPNTLVRIGDTEFSDSEYRESPADATRELQLVLDPEFLPGPINPGPSRPLFFSNGKSGPARGARRRAASSLRTTVLCPILVPSRPNSPRKSGEQEGLKSLSVVQAEKPSLVSGGLLRMISPVSDTFK